MTNVISLHNGQPQPEPGTPNQALIASLEQLLNDARSGMLQSMIGTGFTADGGRMSMWAGHHINVYEMLGAIAWLEHEYVHRITTDDDT